MINGNTGDVVRDTHIILRMGDRFAPLLLVLGLGEQIQRPYEQLLCVYPSFLNSLKT